jgi:hypothetical protein
MTFSSKTARPFRRAQCRDALSRAISTARQEKTLRLLRAHVTPSADFSEDGQKLLTNSEMRGTMIMDKSVRKLPKPTLPLLCDSAKLRGRRRARKACPELVEGRAPPAVDSGFSIEGAQCDESAKRKSGQPIENKQSREMIDSAHIMIPRT